MNRFFKRLKKTSPMRIFAFLILFILTTSYIALVIWAFLCSLKGKVEYVVDKVSLPKDWLFSNYKNAWNTLQGSGKSVPEMIFNALWISAGGILLSDLTTPAISYVVARYKFPGRRFLRGCSLFMMMVPIMGALPAQYRMYLNLGLYDSPLMLIPAIGGIGYSMILWSSIFKGVSWSLAEAAYIDGANHFQIYFRIMFPQIVPVLIGLNISSFLGTWNDYTTPLLFYPSYPTLASGLYVYQQEAGRALNYPFLFAGVIMCGIPSLTIFACFQNYFMKIDLSGGLKG